MVKFLCAPRGKRVPHPAARLAFAPLWPRSDFTKDLAGSIDAFARHRLAQRDYTDFLWCDFPNLRVFQNV
jgi:hypothetical protein